MTPLKDTFGEEWVEMDEHEEHLEKNNIASLEAKVGASSGASQREREDLNKTVEDHENIMFEPMIKSRRVQNIGKNKEEFMIEGKCNLERESLEEALVKENGGLDFMDKHFIKLDLNEQYLEMEPSRYDMTDKATLKEKSEEPSRPCFGRKQSTSLLKRVMSEASFMQGQIMVSKSECVQEIISKREGSKAKEGAKGGDTHNIISVRKREKSEENLVEVEVTIEKWSNEEQKSIMEGEEMLLFCIPPWSLRKTLVHKPAPDEVHQQETTLEMHPQPMGSKAGLKVHQQESEALQHSPKQPSEDELPQAAQAHRKGGISRALDAVGMHAKEEKASAKTQSKTTGIAEKPLKTSGELHMEEKANKIPSKAKKEIRRRMKALEVFRMGEALQSEQGEGRNQTSTGQLEVKEVECECCGLGEECTTGYIDHVKGVFSGHWVCGLCAEAVNEERHRLGRGIPMEEAVRIHMNLCKQFSSKKKAGEPPHSPGVAHAVCHLLSRHLSDPTSPRQVTTTPIRPLLSRTSSCLPSFSHKPPCAS